MLFTDSCKMSIYHPSSQLQNTKWRENHFIVIIIFLKDYSWRRKNTISHKTDHFLLDWWFFFSMYSPFQLPLALSNADIVKTIKEKKFKYNYWSLNICAWLIYHLKLLYYLTLCLYSIRNKFNFRDIIKYSSNDFDYKYIFNWTCMWKYTLAMSIFILHMILEKFIMYFSGLYELCFMCYLSIYNHCLSN